MQAARGTSLSDTEPPPSTRPSGASPRFRRTFAVVAVVAYAIDVATKVLAVEKLSGGADVELVGSWLVLHLTRNPGAAFSTGTEFTLVLSAIAIAAVAAVVHFGRRVGTRAWAWALGLLLAGVCGNLTDRLLREPGPLRGHVVDFLMVPNWPVFNIADICINVAAALILLQAIRGIGIDGTRAAAREREA
jgi:signal peptidase II